MALRGRGLWGWVRGPKELNRTQYLGEDKGRKESQGNWGAQDSRRILKGEDERELTYHLGPPTVWPWALAM